MLRRRIYQALSKRLRDHLPQLNYIDLQKRQMAQARASESYPIPLPACLIEFRTVNWSGTGGGQIGATTVSLHLYTHHLEDTFEGNEGNPASLDDLDLIDEVYEAVQGFATDDMGPMNRTMDLIETFQQGYAAYRVDFETILFQPEAQGRMVPKPNVELIIKNDE